MDWSALEVEQEESLMTEAELEAFMASLECSSEGSDCVDGPPFFSSPPPPPPPWLDALPGCYGTGNCADSPMVTSLEGNMQDLIQTVAVIVVSSLVIVLTLVLGAAMVFRRWKAGRKEEREAAEQMREFTVAGKDLEQSTAPRSTNLYISEQQLMVEVGRGLDGLLPPPALVIGGVPFHLVQQQLEEPIYHSIDSEHYSDLSSFGSSLSSSGNSGKPREGEYVEHNQEQARVQDQHLREAEDVKMRNYPLPRLYYLRPHSSQSVQYAQPTQLFQPPDWRSSSLPGPWRPGPPCPPAYTNRSSMEEGRGEVGSPQEGTVTSL